MAGQSRLSASTEQRAALAFGPDRAEAARARAILLTPEGWTSPPVGDQCGVRDDTVRLWRCDFVRGGVEALKDSCGARCGARQGGGSPGGERARRGSHQMDLGPIGR